MGEMRITVECSGKLTEARLKAYSLLSSVVWPFDPNATPKEIASEDASSRPDRIIAFVEEEGAIIAGAEGFARVIHPENRPPIKVLALSSVCTHPDYRMKGLAAKLVKAMLKRVDDGEFPVALWQTGVPEFYEKLGARKVTNRFVNRLHPTDKEKSPFWDNFIMIYPANADWPDSVIDLNGLGY